MHINGQSKSFLKIRDFGSFVKIYCNNINTMNVVYVQVFYVDLEEIYKKENRMCIIHIP